MSKGWILTLPHHSDYFDWTGRTMHFTHGEFVESSHSERGKDTWIQGEKGARDPKTLGTNLVDAINRLHL